jgi:hypothetical protein
MGLLQLPSRLVTAGGSRNASDSGCIVQPPADCNGHGVVEACSCTCNQGYANDLSVSATVCLTLGPAAVLAECIMNALNCRCHVAMLAGLWQCQQCFSSSL